MNVGELIKELQKYEEDVPVDVVTTFGSYEVTRATPEEDHEAKFRIILEFE